jgi:hypothetical protein
MTTPAAPGTVSLSVTLTERFAHMLWVNAAANFYAEQADRFELVGDFDLPLPTDELFAGGTMSWCDSASDALLFRAYEEACGHTVTLLWDLAVEGHYVVLSSRRFASRSGA